MLFRQEKELLGVLLPKMKMDVSFNRTILSQLLKLKLVVIFRVSLVNCDLLDPHHAFDKLLTDRQRNFLIILGGSDVENFIISAHIRVRGNFPTLLLYKLQLVINLDFLLMPHHKGSKRWEPDAFSTLDIFGLNVDLKVMIELPRVNCNTFLAGLKADTVSFGRSDHHH